MSIKKNKTTTTVCFDRKLLEELDRRRGKHINRSGYLAMLVEDHFANSKVIEVK